MTLGRIVGMVTTSRYEGGLSGGRLVLVQGTGTDGKSPKKAGAPVLALDAVQAGLGDLVLLSQGSSCRNLMETRDRAVDALVVGIVDLVDHDGALVYAKASDG